MSSALPTATISSPRIATAAAILGGIGLLAAPAFAWEPTRTVEFIVPAGTGGGADQMARVIQGIIAKHQLMKQTMVVINKAGGAGGEGSGRVLQQVDAVEAGVARELGDLRADRVELRREAGADRGVGGLHRLRGKRLTGLHQLGDRGDAVVGGLDGVDARRHRVEQVAQVAGTVLQALRGEEIDRVVECAVDALAGG